MLPSPAPPRPYPRSPPPANSTRAPNTTTIHRRPHNNASSPPRQRRPPPPQTASVMSCHPAAAVGAVVMIVVVAVVMLVAALVPRPYPPYACHSQKKPDGVVGWGSNPTMVAAVGAGWFSLPLPSVTRTAVATRAISHTHSPRSRDVFVCRVPCLAKTSLLTPIVLFGIGHQLFVMSAAWTEHTALHRRAPHLLPLPSIRIDIGSAFCF